MTKTNAKWQHIDRFWFLGGWIHPCQMFDFGENRLKTLTLWLGHLKGIVRQFGGRIWKSRSNTTRKWYQLKIFKIPSVWSSVWIYCIASVKEYKVKSRAMTHSNLMLHSCPRVQYSSGKIKSIRHIDFLKNCMQRLSNPEIRAVFFIYSML